MYLILKAVHFLLMDHLDRGVSFSSAYDGLVMNMAESLQRRAKVFAQDRICIIYLVKKLCYPE